MSQKNLSGGAKAKYDGKRGDVIWLTGLSGSGKSTIASHVSDELQRLGNQVIILDGDNIRQGLCSDLMFSIEDRKENIRRVAEVSRLLSENGITTITSFISPIAEDRISASAIIGNDSFKEIFVSCPLEVCESRDPKGLYKKARDGFIKNFTGIESPYIPPENPHVVVETDKYTIGECVDIIMSSLKGY